MKAKNDEIYEAGYQAGLRAAGAARFQRQPAPGRNQSAFIIGFIAGCFGIWGLSYVLNGKVGIGCLWMLFIGPFIAAVLAGLILAFPVFGLLVLPLWLGIVYVQAKNGAQN